MSQVFYGSVTCEKPRCTNKAYWKTAQGHVCGIHSKRASRSPLQKDPYAKQKAAKQRRERQRLVEEQAATNISLGRKGTVKCAKLRMMSKAPHIDGYLKVFPNFKHENRTDGFGCKSLSPKFMGPIHHQEPKLPSAKNLENYHQSAKVFPHEVDEKGNPKPEFWTLLAERYQDTKPYRHKYSKAFLKSASLVNNAHIPLLHVSSYARRHRT